MVLWIWLGLGGARGESGLEVAVKGIVLGRRHEDREAPALTMLAGEFDGAVAQGGPLGWGSGEPCGVGFTRIMM